MGTSANAVTMDITEVSIGDFSEFVSSSGLITRVEQHGGMVYESGWVVKPKWNWRAPYGEISPVNEPVVHVTYSEARQYCEWKGKRLPTKQEWIEAGYTESRLLLQMVSLLERLILIQPGMLRQAQTVCLIVKLKHFC